MYRIHNYLVLGLAALLAAVACKSTSVKSAIAPDPELEAKVEAQPGILHF